MSSSALLEISPLRTLRTLPDVLRAVHMRQMPMQQPNRGRSPACSACSSRLRPSMVARLPERAKLTLPSVKSLVAGGGGPDRELERLLARHNRSPGVKPILELNMRHALVKALARAKAEARETDVDDLAALLFDEAQILDGEVPDDPAAFMARLNRFILRGLPPPQGDPA
jgi:hypothetical protein